MPEWEPGDPIHPRPQVDPEITACEVIDNAFGALDDEARARVLRWAIDRYVEPGPVDWPARFRAAAEVAEGAGWRGTAANIRDLAHRCADEERRHVVEAIGRAFLGEAL